MPQLAKTKAKHGPWGRLQSKGQKRAFSEEQVQLIRATLDIRGEIMQRALLELAISTSLRSSDLLPLRVADVLSVNGIVDSLPIKQRKTGKVVLARVNQKARERLLAWIQDGGLTKDARLFAFSRQTYGTLVKGWANIAHADPRFYSTHSMRRTAPTHVFKKTKNAAAAARMLGHTNLAETIAYLGVDTDEAHKLAEEHDI